MAATQVTIHVRMRRVWPLHVAVWLRSIRLARLAVPLVRTEWRQTGTKQWHRIPGHFEVTE